MAMQETELQHLIEIEKKETPPDTSNLVATETHPLQTKDYPEDFDDLASIEEPIVNLESLHKIASVKDDLVKVKSTLVAIVDTMAADPSMITQWSKYWGELPLWQKILGGVALSAPTVAAGLFAHMATLLMIGGVTGVAYTASGIILDDHHVHNVSIAERLKQGVSDLAELLMVTISALEAIANDLKIEIAKFAKENTKLADNVSELQSEVESLTNQVELFKKTQELLRETREDLERTAESLKSSVVQQTELLNKNQLMLDQVKAEYEKNEQQLSLKIAELLAVRKGMELELNRAKLVSVTLQGTVTTLTDAAINGKEQQEQFLANLDTLLKDESGGFGKFATQICEAEKQLVVVRQQLHESKERYNALLDRQEEQVTRLEQLGIENIPAKVNTADAINTKGLRQHGIYKPASRCDASSAIPSFQAQPLRVS